MAKLGILKNELDPNYSCYYHYLDHEAFSKLEDIVYERAPNHRSEVSFPISAWRGRLGINQTILAQFLVEFEKLAL